MRVPCLKVAIPATALLTVLLPAALCTRLALATGEAESFAASRSESLIAAAEHGARPRVPTVLDLPVALDLALRHNPGLAAAAWRVRAASGRALDARRRPNPALEVAAEDWGGALGSGRIETTLALSQTFELGGDRAARGASARAGELLATAELTAEERELLGAVTERYLAAWLAQERCWQQREAERIAADAVAAAAERVRAGAASPVERVRAEGQLALRRADLRRAEADVAITRRALALDWGAAEAGLDSLALEQPDVTPPPPPEQVVSRLRAHPERARIAAELAAAEAGVREARAARVPDLDARFGVRRVEESRGTGFVAGLSIPLPLWSTQRGAVLAAAAERSATTLRQRQVEWRLEERLRSLHDRLGATIEAYVGVRDRVLPSTEEALGFLRSGYRSGRLSYVDLAEGQRAALEARLAFLEAARDLWSARLELERLVGTAGGPAGGPEGR